VEVKVYFPSTLELVDVLISLPSVGSRPHPSTRKEEWTPFQRGGYRFGFCDPTSPDEDPAEYFVTDLVESEMEPWFLADHPYLVFELITLGREADGFTVQRHKMVSFLERHGPLTRSFAPVGADLTSQATRSRNTINDPRNELRMYQFSRIVEDLTYVTDTQKRLGTQEAVAACINTLDESPRDSLFRALVLQLLTSFQEPPFPRPCVGCGRWFRETADESAAIHRRGWKRADAMYHSARCRKAALERVRRARVKKKANDSTLRPTGA
jgi:hypothetical protein